MAKSDTLFIAIGGGDLTKAESVLSQFLEAVRKNRDARLLVMTVATNDPRAASKKYNALFRSRGVNHVDAMDVSIREDAYEKRAVEKAENADAFFFTGGDQLNITTLLGGSPLGQKIQERANEGVIVAGTSAGAAMMPKTMIISGESVKPPTVGGVEIAPGMDLFDSLLIDTHFSQRGRHGRLLAAMAHYPNALGIGLDERTAIFIQGNLFRVVGDGAVTVMDGSGVTINDLPYRGEGERVGIAGVRVDVLPDGYKYNIRKRKPKAPSLKKIRVAGDEE